MFLQDLKYRKIHISLPVIVFILSLFIFNKKKLSYQLIIYNLIFFILIISILVMYMSLKNKRFLNPFQNYFGLGDLLFYMAITPFFILKNYVAFFIASMIFAIVLHFIFKKKTNQTIPLAGFSSLLLLIVIFIDLLFNFQKITILI
jgi:hypothetical protein